MGGGSFSLSVVFPAFNSLSRNVKSASEPRRGRDEGTPSRKGAREGISWTTGRQLQ